ncbi:MAG: chloramphenicol acetyltransferase [Chitinophagaceae bacterium]|nr:MAG: chloramphenicol acetyltransferase [Chitinophagaceae bacterium]
MRLIDTEHWNRKEHFEFFSRMASPYFGIVCEVDCTEAYASAKAAGHSFFATYLHRSMTAVNAVEELGYRIVDGQVLAFDVIHAGTTISREDGTFGFAFIPYTPGFEAFNAELQREIVAVRATTGLRLNNDDIKKNLVRHSTYPWGPFTGLLHPTNLDPTESVPKITFGGFTERAGRKYLPVSVEAHHGLVDGLHIAHYFQEFGRLLAR